MSLLYCSEVGRGFKPMFIVSVLLRKEGRWPGG